MVQTLQELCYIRLANQMIAAPPMIQEIIMGETKKHMEERITQEIVAKKLNNMERSLSYMIPDIMEDLIHIIVTPGALRYDYLSRYCLVNPSLVQCAIDIAEEAIRRMEERYIHQSFLSNNCEYYDEGEEDNEYNEEDYEEETRNCWGV